MVAKGISVTIISDGNPTQTETEELDGIQIDRINHLVLAPLLKKEELVRVITKRNPDVVVWCGSPLSAVYLSRLGRVGRPFIWDIDTDINNLKSLRGISIREFLHPHHGLLLNQLLTAILPRPLIRSTGNSRLVSKITVPGKYLKESLVNIGVHATKVTIVPSTIENGKQSSEDVKEQREEVRTKLGFKPGQFVVTYFGSPCSLRGPDTAILSMPKILSKHKDTKLVILSRKEKQKTTSAARNDEVEEDYLRRLVGKFRLDANVEIVSDLLDRSQLRERLLASDAIVLPFKLIFSEPPLSVLEAMSLGKTVLSTNLTVLQEILQEDRGILVEPGHHKALAEAVLFIIEHQKQSERYGKNALRYTKNLPDWEEVTNQFAQILKSVIEQNRSISS
jgi:glycosyltransferase involved in cell wall biosynthesis